MIHIVQPGDIIQFPGGVRAVVLANATASHGRQPLDDDETMFDADEPIVFHPPTRKPSPDPPPRPPLDDYETTKPRVWNPPPPSRPAPSNVLINEGSQRVVPMPPTPPPNRVIIEGQP